MVLTTHCSLKAMSLKTALIWRTVGRMYSPRTVKGWGASDHPRVTGQVTVTSSLWSCPSLTFFLSCCFLPTASPMPHPPPINTVLTTWCYISAYSLTTWNFMRRAGMFSISHYQSLVLLSKYLWNGRTSCIVSSEMAQTISEVLLLVICTYIFWTNIFFWVLIQAIYC